MKATKQQEKPITLTYLERLAAISVYNSMNKLDLTRAQMVDAIIAAINDERAAGSP